MMEERILHRLKNGSHGLPAVQSRVERFGSFPSHTIYINVLRTSLTRPLHWQLAEYIYIYGMRRKAAKIFQLDF